MGKYIIDGGKSLNGEIHTGGAKNAVLPILASTLLNGGVSYLKNVPMLTDTFVAIDILKELGCDVELGADYVKIDSKNMNKTKVSERLVKKMRSSIIFLGSILARFREASIGYPGGCKLGKRPIDFHINSLKKMGAFVKEEDEIINICLKDIKSCTIRLPFPSVGATQNIMLASVLSKTKITITNCAKEPEIVDMANFLNKMGAIIEGVGTNIITIKGVPSLKKYVEHTVMPDRIEAGTFLCMGALNRGDITVKGAIKEHINPLIDVLLKTGCDINVKEDAIHLKAPKVLKPIPFLETNPYPMFPTDMQPQVASLLVVADGESIIKENIFEARNKHIRELNNMGAIIFEKDSIFHIKGSLDIYANTVFAKDLRGGASLINMGLFAKGTTSVFGADYVQRGYEKIEEKLQRVGANIKYVED